MVADATVGALLSEAIANARDAAVLLGTTRCRHRATAFGAGLELADALRSCYELMHTLWGSRFPADAEPVGPTVEAFRCSHRLESLLAEYPQRRVVAAVEPVPRAGSDLQRAWRAAAVAARSAADLLRTHREADGSWRAPESAALDRVSDVLPVVGALARLTRLLAGCSGELQAQCRYLGVGVVALSRHLPPAGELVGVAQRCVDLVESSAGPLAGPVAELGVARPSLRGGAGTAQLPVRLTRLRRAAWALSHRHLTPAGTLVDFAALAVTLSQTGAGHRDQAPAWRALAAQIGQLRTASPALAGVRGDVAVVCQAVRAGRLEPDAHAAVHRAVSHLPELARWNARSLARAAAAGQLYLRAGSLAGDEVSDHPELVVAKLADRVVPVPHARLVAIGAGYSALAGGSARSGTRALVADWYSAPDERAG